ncbi:MAG: foldase protein PrsA [Campylobacterota bacterium]
MKKMIQSGLIAMTLCASLHATEVIATVNGVDITQQDLQSYMQQIPQQARESQNMTKENLQEQLIQRELITQYALKNGIEKEKEYQQLLQKLKRDLALEVWMGKQMDAIEISQEQMREYFENNKERFEQRASEQVRARHILVESEKEAKKYIDQLQKSSDVKSDFQKLAQQHSTCPSAQQGGDLGFFGQGQMVPEFESEVFDLEVGEFTDVPVKTEFGYHVILLDDKKDIYEVVKPTIERNLKMPKFQQRLNEVTKQQQEDAKITKY